MSRSIGNSCNQAYVWYGSFSTHVSQLHHLKTLLSSDENLRADEFLVEKFRNQFIISRGFLRKVLSKYTFVTPSEIMFSYTNYGKPELLHPATSGIQFNLSHSGDFFTIAITHSDSIGVDIEYCDLKTDILEIAEQVFSQNEINRIRSLTQPQQLRKFYETWTIKEAFIKAIGMGFSFNPKQIEVNNDTYSFVFLEKPVKNTVNWFSKPIYIDPNYAGAIVTPKPNINLSIQTTDRI